MSSIFPSELCDYIIDFLWNDYSTLATCSLTCRAWLPSSRSHLFDYVELEHELKILQLLEILNQPPVASVSISRCIRKLALVGIATRSRPHLVRALLQVLDRLDNVECLRINTRGIGGWHMTEAVKDRLLTFSPKIHTLSVSSCHAFGKNTNHLLELITGFPRLSTLAIDGDRWTRMTLTLLASSADALSTDQSERIVIQHLDATSAGIAFTEWLLTWLHGPRFNLVLRKLHIGINHWMRHSALFQLSALDARVLHFDWDALLSQDFAQYDLANYRSLKNIHFDKLPLQFRPDNRTLLHDLLWSIDSPYLHTISFGIVLPSFQACESLNWLTFDNALARLATLRPGLVIQFYLNLSSRARIAEWDHDSGQFHANRLLSQLPKTQNQGVHSIVFISQGTGKLFQGQEVMNVFRFDPVV